MAQIHVFLHRQAMRILIRQNSGIRGLGFPNNAHRPRLIQENIMDQARPPRVDSVCAADAGLADERMPPTVIVSGIVVCSVVVLLGPIDFEIGEWKVVEPSE